MTTPSSTPAQTTADHAIGAPVAEAVAATLKALADPLRLRMLSAISTAPTGEACVCDLAELADVSQPTVSHHLKVLRDVGVLTSERRGTWVWYRVTSGYRGAVTALLDRFAPAAYESHLAHGRDTVAHGLDDVDRELDALAVSLAARLDGVEPGEAQRVVRESYTALARRGGIPTYLVALTEQFARQRLLDTVRARTSTSDTPATPDRRPQVLFVCVANAGRSQLAAALMQHHAGDRVVVRSAGSTPAPAVHAAVRPVLDELGAADVFPKPLTDDAVRAADVVVTMGCGDTCPVLPGTRYEDWAVGDPALASAAGVAAIRDEIDTRVRELLAELLPGDDQGAAAGPNPETPSRALT